MIRYTSGGLQLALENPLTRITPYEGVGDSITADDNTLPDAVARYNWSGDWGSMTVAGILRQMRIDSMNEINPEDQFKDTTTGYGVSVSGKFKVGAKDGCERRLPLDGKCRRWYGPLFWHTSVQWRGAG